MQQWLESKTAGREVRPVVWAVRNQWPGSQEQSTDPSPTSRTPHPRDLSATKREWPGLGDPKFISLDTRLPYCELAVTSSLRWWKGALCAREGPTVRWEELGIQGASERGRLH